MVLASLAVLHSSSQPGTVHHILSTGQSLSVGALGDPGLSMVQPYGNLMLSAFDTLPLIPLVPDTIEGSRNPGKLPQLDEYPLLNAVNQLSFLSGNVYAASKHGAGGAAYSTLSKEANSAFAVGQAQMSRVKSAVVAAGKNYVLDAIYVTHGETDDYNGVTAEQYEAFLAQWQSDYESDSNANVGRSGTLPMFIDQEAAWGAYRGTGAVPTAALGQYLAMEAYRDKIYLVSPKYFFPSAGSIHLTNTDYRWLGELAAKAMKKVLVDHQRWIPLAPKRIDRTNSTVTIQFFVPVGALRFDVVTVPARPNYGFEFFDSDGSATISSVAITSSDTVVLSLSGVPTGTQRLRYAYTALDRLPSGTGNLKDTDPELSRSGNDLSDWAVTFDAPVGFRSNLDRNRDRRLPYRKRR